MDYFVWEGSPTIFSIGTFEFRWYSLLFAVSYYLGYLFMKKAFIKNDRKLEYLDPLLAHLVIGTLVGARLGHCLFYEPQFYLKNPLQIFMVWKGGLASHGGAVGVLIAVILYCRKYKESIIWLLDHLSIPIVLAASFIRLGNFFNSEILGDKTDLPWAIIFKRVDLNPRHPAQLYECLSYFIIYLILFSIYKSWGDKVKPAKLFGIFITAVFSVRVLIEFVKVPQETYENNFILNTGQLLSIPFILIGVYICFFYKMKKIDESKSLQKNNLSQ